MRTVLLVWRRQARLVKASELWASSMDHDEWFRAGREGARRRT